VNGHYESSGGQALPSAPVDWVALAKGIGIEHVERVADVASLRVVFPRARAARKPALLVLTSRSIRTSRSRPTRSGRTRSGRGSRSHDGRGRPRGRGCGRGIFTDLLAWDAAGRMTALKVPTTPEHPAGVLNGLAAIACGGWDE